MENTSTLKIEAGKFYRMRCGDKCEILKTGVRFHAGLKGCCGLKYNSGGDCCLLTYYSDGRFYEVGESNLDLIAPWIDKPEVDWSKMPEGCDSVAMDANRRWYAYPKAPALGAYHWIAPKDSIPIPLYPQHIPKWTGHWRDSLVLREGDV